jgi:hypothetical protein
MNGAFRVGCAGYAGERDESMPFDAAENWQSLAGEPP